MLLRVAHAVRIEPRDIVVCCRKGIMSTEGFWQSFLDAPPMAGPPYTTGFPVQVAKDKFLLLPIRQLPGDGDRAVASLILNQASFAVLDGIAAAMAACARAFRLEVIVGLPTLGLTVAPLVARHLGFANYVALGYSRKFWYDDTLSVSVSSITSPDQTKRLFLDPNLKPRLQGRRALLIDDVVARGTTLSAAQRLLAALPIDIAGAVVAMAQTDTWRSALSDLQLKAVFESPLLERRGDGWWPAKA
jgi:adenine/guanine phosphoribosyltransferase-like PRPP-binding protein